MFLRKSFPWFRGPEIIQKEKADINLEKGAKISVLAQKMVTQV